MSYLHETELEIWVGIGPADIYESFCNFAKGQLILKYLFCVFTFFQKTIENKSTSSKVEFVCSFFERNVGLKN